jgi:hypothetical protein
VELGFVIVGFAAMTLVSGWATDEVIAGWPHSRSYSCA